MKGTFEIRFSDGSTERVEAENSDAAKVAAKNERIRQVDPGRSMPAADLMKHARVKVDAVTEVQPTPAPRPTRVPTGENENRQNGEQS